MIRLKTFEIILTKITGIFGVLISLGLTPFYFILFDLSFLYILGFLFMSSIFTIVFWFLLIKTNHPNTRYNLFSINPNWKSKMDHSLSENPAQLFELDPKDPNLEKKRIREDKIKSIGIV